MEDVSLSPHKSKPRCEFASPGMMNLEIAFQLQQQRNWADLPSLILSNIMEKLPWEQDYIRFGATCAAWRTAFLQSNTNNHSSPPFMLIPPFVASQNNKRKRKSETPDKDLLSLYSISRNKVCNFQVKVPHSRYTVGSSLGWLLTMKPKKYGIRKVKYYVELQNPFLPDSDVIHLPQLPFHNILAEEEEDPFMYVHKGVLSSPPDNNLNKNFILMAIMTRDYKLAFFNPATKQFCWTPVGDWDNEKRMAFSDVIYFSKTKQFYVVLLNTGAVYSIDTECSDVPKLTLVTPPTDRLDGFFRRYIVESPSGDLLQLIKLPITDITRSSTTRSVWTIQFEVFKFDSYMGSWVQIHDIGNATLFVGGNSSISRYAPDFPNCKPNCIYFTNESETHFHGGIVSWPEDSGIYNLQVDSVQSHYVMGPNRSLTEPIWIEPTSKK